MHNLPTRRPLIITAALLLTADGRRPLALFLLLLEPPHRISYCRSEQTVDMLDRAAGVWIANNRECR